MTEATPRISIVTPVLNRRTMIEDAIRSVLVQGLDPSEVEHIVVDGGSTDGTVEVLHDYPHLRVISEPDGGVYDAMNKGIRAARGPIVGLLNSDDWYLEGALKAALGAANPDADMVVGGARVTGAVGGERRTVAVQEVPPASGLRLFDLTRGIPNINARFFDRGLFGTLGLFDTDYRIAADREWLLRAWRADITAINLDRDVYEYRQHGGSLTIGGANRALIYEEHLVICSRLLDDPSLDPSLRRELGAWRAREMARSVRLELERNGAAEALRRAVRYSRQQPSWVARALAHRLRRGRATRL